MGLRMIAVDLDGTLLRSDRSISDFTLETLDMCRAQGIRTAVATARSERAARRYIEQIRPDGVVSNGGAMARVDGKTVYRSLIEADTAAKLLTSLLFAPEVGLVSAEANETYFTNQPVEESNPIWRDYLPVQVMDFTRCWTYDAEKINAETADVKGLQALVNNIPDVKLTPFSGIGWCCFTHTLADKWHGVQALAQHWGVEITDVAAFGDDHSDVGMLTHCGMGVAMGNAIAEAKAAAAFACGTNDADGVALWLREKMGIA